MDIKVLQLGKFHPIKGGVEKVMYTFMRGLAIRKIHCDMLCASDDDDVGTTTFDRYSKLIKSKTFTKRHSTMISFRMIYRLRLIAKNYDIVHIHHPDPMAALALFLSGYKGKVVLHWHSDILKQKILLNFYRPIQGWLIDRADLILGTTPVYVEESPFLQAVKPKLGFLPIGVRERSARDTSIAQIRNKYAGKKIVYSMGRLVEYKGFEYLIKSARYLPDDYIILIGGKGPKRGELQALVEKEGLGERVEILGFVPQEAEAAYYGACDVFCISSIMKTEAYAIVQVEAMSAGKPIVATTINGSGVAWVNKHGVSGLNVPPRDSKAIADAVQEICSNEETYQRFCYGAKSRFKKYFTMPQMFDGLLKFYSQVLDLKEPDTLEK